jgi:hypothetical protein
MVRLNEIKEKLKEFYFDETGLVSQKKLVVAGIVAASVSLPDVFGHRSCSAHASHADISVSSHLNCPSIQAPTTPSAHGNNPTSSHSDRGHTRAAHGSGHCNTASTAVHANLVQNIGQAGSISDSSGTLHGNHDHCAAAAETADDSAIFITHGSSHFS